MDWKLSPGWESARMDSGEEAVSCTEGKESVEEAIRERPESFPILAFILE